MSNVTSLLAELKLMDPACQNIAKDLQVIEESFALGHLLLEERNHLIAEIRDIRAAQECAGNELAMRYVVQACNLILSVA